MKFLNKHILIVSPEPWNGLQLSKHHYAIELARRGNTVYFLNPPSKGRVRIEKTNHLRLFTIDYSPRIRGINKISFLGKSVIDMATRFNILPILKGMQHPIDIIWSFDAYRFQNLKLFDVQLRIYHPVDYFDTSLDRTCADTADVIFSVSRSILRKYEGSNTPSFFVNHGLSPAFLVQDDSQQTNSTRLRCGYVGNLTSFALHQTNFLQIIEQNPDIEFHLIGPYANSQGQFKNFVDKLIAHPNTILHGDKSSDEVAQLIRPLDLFLICYDTQRYRLIASNTHKMLEYLSTGKVVVSSFIEAYSDQDANLICMATSDYDLPSLFKSTISRISKLNASILQQKRKEYASAHSYENQTSAVEEFVSRLKEQP